MKDSPNLDLLRALAVTLVVGSHLVLVLRNAPDPALYDVHSVGRIGVAIFFVHTTLVLMGSLQRHGHAAVPFFIRRFMRIYPLSMAVVLLFGLTKLASGIPIAWPEFLSNLLLVQNITGHISTPGPLWSLPFEVQMYMVLPALYGVTRSRRPVLWGALLCVGAIILCLALPRDSLAFGLSRWVPCFLPGMLAFVLSRRVHAQVSPFVLFSLVGVAALVAVPMLVAAGVPQIYLLWALCLALGLTIPFCRELTSAPIARGSKLIATYSYGVYLTHVLALGMFEGLLPGPPMAQWGAMLVLLPGLAYIGYHGIEKHGIALGSRWGESLRSAPPQSGRGLPVRAPH